MASVKSKAKVKNIILLEDEVVLGQIYQKKLEQAGFSVKTVRTLDDFEKALVDFKPDAAFLDYGLGGENQTGLAVIPALKKAAPKAKIVVLSNYSLFHIQKKVMAAGADDCLLKIDTTPAALVAYVKNLS